MRFLQAGANKGGAITLGGTAQDVAAANTIRRGLHIQNTSDTEMRVTETNADATATTGFKLLAGERLEIQTNQRVSIFCATTGKTFAATEF